MVVKKIDYDKCIKCLKCYNLCPMDVFSVEDKQVIIKYADDCQSCYLCVYECKPNALKVEPDRPIEIFDVYNKGFFNLDNAN